MAPVRFSQALAQARAGPLAASQRSDRVIAGRVDVRHAWCGGMRVTRSLMVGLACGAAVGVGAAIYLGVASSTHPAKPPGGTARVAPGQARLKYVSERTA